MARYGFMMKLKNSSKIEEYEDLHKEVWEDVIEAHRRSGFRNYSIFRSGLDLFACFESDDPKACFDRIAREPVMKSWWAKTTPLMEKDKDNKPRFIPIPEVFHMD